MSRVVALFVLLLVPASLVAFLQAPVVPPIAKTIPYTIELHGETRTDPYYWMKDKKDPEVIRHLKAENAYTASIMNSTEALQRQLYKEMLGRIKQTDESVPYREGGYRYYHRTVEGKQYRIYCRKNDSTGSAEQVILDENELARGQPYFAVGGMRISDDGNLLAYSTDTTGFREYELSVKDLRTGQMIESRLVKAPAFEWSADSTTLFYTTEDDAKRAHKLWRHTLGQPKANDVLLFEEKDELFWLELSRSRDRKYLFRSSDSYLGGEQAYLSAATPRGDWTTILPRESKHEYAAEHRDGKFYIRTNKNATNFRVVTCPVGKTDPANWTDLVPHDPKVFVEGFAVFQNFAVITERENADPQLRILNLRESGSHRVAFEGSVYDTGLGTNREFDTGAIQITYSSPITPPTVYEYDVVTKTRTQLKQETVLGGYDATAYCTERVWATAPDGAKVPISLVSKKGVKRDGRAPCLLYGYGAYGITMEPEFDSNYVSLLDRGVVYAMAHVRGGNDLGRAWYDAGKMMNKKNTFTDFIACADFLVKERYCARDRLAIRGASAGGLLIGAVVNARPDLCKAAILQVPFVDAITTMSDETIPLTVQEFHQWGNPKKKDEYEYMRSYCPYSNLRKADYPAILVMTSLNDSQVLFHEPTKYVAKLRMLKTDANPLLLKCNMDAGHGGASGRYDALKEEAFMTAFLLNQMAVKE